MKEIRVNQIKGYENIKDQYKVLSDGRCVNTADNKILSIKFDKDGYPQYQLITLDNKIRNVKIHRILAQWLIPNPNNLPMVRHLNDNKLDWRLENLAWGNDSHNMYDAVRNGNHRSIISKSTRCIETGKVYNSQKDAAHDVGIHPYGITCVLKGCQKTAGGYHWERVNEK